VIVVQRPLCVIKNLTLSGIAKAHSNQGAGREVSPRLSRFLASGDSLPMD